MGPVATPHNDVICFPRVGLIIDNFPVLVIHYIERKRAILVLEEATCHVQASVNYPDHAVCSGDIRVENGIQLVRGP